MKRLLTLLTPLLALFLTGIACNWQIRSADPTVTPTITPVLTATKALPTLFPTPPNALGITGNVYVRKSPSANDKALGVLDAGDSIVAVCNGNWCQIIGGYIWRGCTDDNPNRLGCKER